MSTITILGFLGNDPEERFTKSGLKVYSFNVASTVYDKGEKSTMWYSCSCFIDLPIFKYLKKGSGVVVSGELRPVRMYQSKSGETKYSLQVIAHSVGFLPGSKKQEDSAPSVHDKQEETQQPTHVDNDLPF